MAEDDREREESKAPPRDPVTRRRRSERQMQSEAPDQQRPLRGPDFDPTSRGDESGEVL